jgi:hypothetical protein
MNPPAPVTRTFFPFQFTTLLYSGRYQIRKMQQADHMEGIIDDRQDRGPFPAARRHHRERLDSLRGLQNRDGFRVHQLLDRKIEDVCLALQSPPDVEVGDQADEPVVVIDDGDGSSLAFGDPDQHGLDGVTR